MKRITLILALVLSGCATTDNFFGPRVLSAGESYCNGTPAQCAELFAMIAPLMTPEMDAIIKRAQCEAQKELC